MKTGIDRLYRSRALASPGWGQDWFGFIAYESAWDHALCEPETETLDQMQARLAIAERTICELQWRIRCAVSDLRG